MNDMETIMPPHRLLYLLVKEFAEESDEPSWPVVAGHTAQVIANEYARDYNRCVEISRMALTAANERRRNAKADEPHPPPRRLS